MNESESADKSPRKGENAANHNAETNKAAQSAVNDDQAESHAAGSKLPVVWSPTLDAGEAIADDLLGAGDDETMASAADAPDGESSEPLGEPAHNAAPPRSLRFAVLAASLAAAAAVGSLAGSFSATGIAHFWPAGAANANKMANYGSPQSGKAELADLAGLKTSLDGASHSVNGQLAKLAERLDRIERAQAEPTAKLAHMADAIDRLEKRTVPASAVAPETTGSISANPPAPPAEAKPPENVLRDWIVEGVHGGRALIGNRYGGIFDITTGSVLPGLGRVETIKRQDGQWIVVTARGVIYSVP